MISTHVMAKPRIGVLSPLDATREGRSSNADWPPESGRSSPAASARNWDRHHGSLSSNLVAALPVRGVVMRHSVVWHRYALRIGFAWAEDTSSPAPASFSAPHRRAKPERTV